MGKERRSLILSDEEKKTTAYHEAGHAIIAKLLPGTDPVHKVSILPRGRALGLTMQLPETDRHSYNREYLVNTLMVLLAGRVAEELVLGTITTGAGNDIERATAMARRMVCEWGMSETIGLIAVGDSSSEVFIGREWTLQRNFSEDTARVVDAEVRKLIEKSHADCKELISQNLDFLHAMANTLLDRETITGSDIDLLLQGKPLPPMFETDKSKDTDPNKVSEAIKSYAQHAKAAQNADDDEFLLDNGDDADRDK
jgi:cell division protease FtsH